jgi:transposase
MEGVCLSHREEVSFWILEDYRSGKIDRKAAAEILGVDPKTISRRSKRVRERGLAGLLHGNKGKPAPNRLSEALREEALTLLKERYFDFNLTHAHEMLRDRHGLNVSYGTLYTWAKKAAVLAGKKKRRASRARVQRERMANEGLLLQMDGSHHRWNGKDEWVLIAMIDDATSDIPVAEFFEGETTLACLKLLRELVEKRGIPDIIYTDEAGWADRPTGKRQQFSQFKRACEELGIRLLTTRSPQAKGRIERAWRTFQDRLVPELRLHEITSMAGGNQYLKQAFLPLYWQKRRVEARHPTTRYRPLPAHLNLADITCLKYDRQVTSDHCVSFEADRYRIVDLRFGSLRGKDVAVHRYPDGEVRIFHGHLALKIEKLRPPKRQWDQKPA